jgi:FdhD protein
MDREPPEHDPGSIRAVEARRISTADEPSPPEPEHEIVSVVEEIALTIDVEGVESYTVVCTPVDREALAVGFLFSEGIIDGMSDIAVLRPCQDQPNTMRVRLSGGVPRIGDPARNLLIVSSCGACGTEDLAAKLEALPRVGHSLRVQAPVLRAVARELCSSQPLFNACGGTHAVGIFDAAGQTIACAEDTGRHNALDKAIGKCLMRGQSAAGCGAMLSGRVSLEMVSKCARAGIELIAAISAPTSLAVDVAERCGITLCAFVRQTRATLFSHPGRVVGGR